MAPNRAIRYIDYFNLPPDERLCLIERDVRGKSYAQISDAHNMSPETIKRYRQRAFAHIADAIQHNDTPTV